MDKNEAGHGGGDPSEQFPVAGEEEDDGCGDLYKDIIVSEEFLQWRRKNEDQLKQINHEQVAAENKARVIPAVVESRSKDNEEPSSRIPNLGNSSGDVGGGAILFVGELEWWTTDAELDSELGKYGVVKDVHFFTSSCNGKSLGYCQVEFYERAAAIACKEGMNGHRFHGRACVVEHATPFTVKRMGDAQENRRLQKMRRELNVNLPGDLPPPYPGGGRAHWGRGMGNRVAIGSSMGGRGSYGNPPFFGREMPLNVNMGKEKGSERLFSGRRYQDDRGGDYERDPRKGKDIARDHGHRGDERDVGRERGKDREKARERSLEQVRHRGRDHERERRSDDRSTRNRSKSRSLHEEEQRSGSRDADYDRDRGRNRERRRDARGGGGGYERDPRKGKEIVRDHGHRRERDRERSLEQGRHRGRERERRRGDRSTRSRSKSRSLHEEEQRSRSRDADYDRDRGRTRERHRNDRDRKLGDDHQSKRSKSRDGS